MSGSDLPERLRAWAEARDRRYEQDHPHGAHGKTGTALLREAAEALDVQGARLQRAEASAEAGQELLSALDDAIAAADLDSWDAPYRIEATTFNAPADRLRSALRAQAEPALPAPASSGPVPGEQP